MHFYNEQSNVCNERGEVIARIVSVSCGQSWAKKIAEYAAEKLNDIAALGDSAAFETQDEGYPND